MSDRDLAGRRILAVTEEELQRIVLDIHDGPVQNLFAALSQLSTVRRRLAGHRDAAHACARELSSATRLLESSLDGIRDVLTAFHAPEFAGLGLAELVEELAVQHEALTSATVTLDTEHPIPDIPLVVKIALFRILQEALSNIRRHAGEQAATVRLAVRGNTLEMEIEDRGKGFSPPPLVGPQATERRVHIGLRGMRERAALVNGELSVESRPGEGTRVGVRIPIDA